MVVSVWSFERGAIPVRGGGGGGVGALEELEEHGVGVGGGADELVGQDELAEIVVPAGTRQRHGGIPVAGRVGVGVGVEDAFLAGWTGPVAAAADFVRVRLPHHVGSTVRCATGMWR